MSHHSDWSRYFGLAWSPLFEKDEIPAPEQHTVLLDGGYGSFILSEQAASDTDFRQAASWAWSAYLPHHVTIGGEAVIVTRWDRPEETEKFTYKSVNDKLDTFYEYLCRDRVTGKRDVISTILDLFRAVRGEIRAAGLADATSIQTFLSILEKFRKTEKHLNSGASVSPPFSEEKNLDVGIKSTALDRLEVGFRSEIKSSLGFDFNASLAVRHAASAIFQEAHFIFESGTQTDLFAYQSTSISRPLTRGAHHFTPAPLARSIIEQALSGLPDIGSRSQLTVCDPACGSGAFLVETLRALRRLDYKGALKLIGRDLSVAAIDMAQFVVRAAAADWHPKGGLAVDISVGDSLGNSLMPRADVIIMNPPFVAWPMMDTGLRERVKNILGETARHRPDSSMAFVARALDSIEPGGVVASLLPASVLSLESAKGWRKDLLQRGRLFFLGYFGDYGLFVHALVHVAAIVIATGQKPNGIIALRASNKSNATGEALRALRRMRKPIVSGAGERGWRITTLSQNELAQRDNWRVLPESVEEALRRLKELGMPTIGDVFRVRQGIRTGLSKIFILSDDQLKSLQDEERKYFRPAIFRDSISSGIISEKYYVFFPYKRGQLTFAGEADLRKEVPTYFKGYLLPKKTELQKRSGVSEQERPWWALSRYYKWSESRRPRIVSKYFGAEGAFAFDNHGHYVPIQAYAWFPKRPLGSETAESALIPTLLKAYCALFNSAAFSKLLSVFSDRVAGGQFDLSPRFVNAIPIPNLKNLEGPLVRDLAAAMDSNQTNSNVRIDEYAELAWGPTLIRALAEINDE